MMGHREKMIDGSEYDLLTKSRKYLRPGRGIPVLIKRKFNKRVRRIARIEARREAF